MCLNSETHTMHRGNLCALPEVTCVEIMGHHGLFALCTSWSQSDLWSSLPGTWWCKALNYFTGQQQPRHLMWRCNRAQRGN